MGQTPAWGCCPGLACLPPLGGPPSTSSPPFVLTGLKTNKDQENCSFGDSFPYPATNCNRGDEIKKRNLNRKTKLGRDVNSRFATQGLESSSRRAS